MLSSYYGNGNIPKLRFHQIKTGDFKPGEDIVGSIAQRYGVQASHILESNPGIKPTTEETNTPATADTLVGQILVINLQHSDSIVT